MRFLFPCSPSVGRSLAGPMLVLAMCLGAALPSGAQTVGPGAAGLPGSAASARTADEQREMVEDLSHASLAAIEMGRLALDKSQNLQVRRHAQQMIEDHTQALQALQQLAQSQQMPVPSEIDFQHKAIATAMRLLGGATFDRQYIRQSGIKDSRRTVDLLMRMQQSASDPALRAHAAKLLPIVQRQLVMARELDVALK